MIALALNPAEYKRWQKAIFKVNYLVHKELPLLSYRCAVEYASLLKMNIKTGKYAGGYAPLNKRWAARKSGDKFWLDTGALMNSIQAFPTSDSAGEKAWMGGIPPGATNAWGRSISMYGSINEDLRPLFEPTLAEFIANNWEKRIAQMLPIIEGGWS